METTASNPQPRSTQTSTQGNYQLTNQTNMTKLPEGKSRLDLVRQGLVDGGLKKRGRLIVSIDRLKEDPKNERRTFREMDGLIASIKSVGLVEPITVAPIDGEGESAFQIVTGHRRFRAAKSAGLTEVEVLIREPEDETRRRVKSIVSNVQREDIGPVEMAEALQSLLDDRQVENQQKLAELIGKDKTWVSRMLRILDLPVALKAKVASTQLSVSYDSVAEIARVSGEEDQARLIDAVISGTSQAQIRDEIRQIKGQPTKDTASGSASPKPKRVYHTAHKATVIVQATTTRLTTDETVAALKEALDQATGKKSPDAKPRDESGSAKP
jgi:ParB/RepB/Spo0J family partition protein